MSKPLQYELITVSLPSADQVHLIRLYTENGATNKNSQGTPVFMLHSSMQDSSTFYSENGKGLARYLAQRGFDVYVADLRGKGKSWPQIGAKSNFGSHQAINEDIPALLQKIVSKRGVVPQVWIGHGWGSVLLCSVYARYADQFAPVAKMVHFAARRRIQPSNKLKSLLFNVVLTKLAPVLVALHGYLPVRWLRLGVGNESAGSYADYMKWTVSPDWLDTVDGFNYGEAVRRQLLPSSFYFAAKGDQAWGDPVDVRDFIQELGPHDGRLMVLSRAGGNLQNYGHLEQLQHSDCERDHFPVLLTWLQQV